MKMLVWLVAASVLTVSGVSRAQDEKSGPKLSLNILETATGVKTKSVVVHEPKAPLVTTGVQLNEDKASAKTDIVITFVFTKDASDLKTLVWLQEVYTASAGVPFRFNTLPLIFHLFDEDNVCIDKITIKSIEGDVSGARGDAFRASLSCLADTYKRTKRIEARVYLLPPSK